MPCDKGFARAFLNQALIFFIVFCTSCARREFTFWKPDVTVPIARGSLGLNHIVPDSILIVDSSGIWHIFFERNLLNFDVDTLVDIPDTVIRNAFGLPILGGPFYYPPGQHLFDIDQANRLDLSEVLLREARLKQGVLNYRLKSTVNGSLRCAYTLQGVLRNGLPVILESTTQPASETNPFIYEGSMDISNCTFDLTGGVGQYNRIATNLDISVASDAPDSAAIATGDSVIFELRFDDLELSYARGFLGSRNEAIDETVSLSKDFNMPQGIIDLDQVSVSLHIENPIGADAILSIDEFAGNNYHGGTLVALSYPPIFSDLLFTRAIDQQGSILSSNKNFLMTPANSNVDQFIENLPDELRLRGNIEINPLGDVSDANDFIYFDRLLEANVGFDLPLNVGFNELTLRDTFDVNSGTELPEMDGNLILVVDNHFPFEAFADLKLIAANGMSYSLLSDGFVAPAILMADERTTQVRRSELLIPVNRDVLSLVQASSKIAVSIALTTDDSAVRRAIYEEYHMDLQLIGSGSIEVSAH